MSDEQVEKVARVLVPPKAQPSDWRYWTDEARAAIAMLRPLLRAEALEEAARVAEKWHDPFNDDPGDGNEIAAAIRALVKEDRPEDRPKTD